MVTFDTNLVVYAANSHAPEHRLARDFLEKMAGQSDVVVCELILVEIYLKIRNAKILANPFPASEAKAFCQRFRSHPHWRLIDSAPVMKAVWEKAGTPDFAIRRIIDARIAFTLRHYGVTEFATTNVKDFQDFGFSRVWNPLVET